MTASNHALEVNVTQRTQVRRVHGLLSKPRVVCPAVRVCFLLLLQIFWNVVVWNSCYSYCVSSSQWWRQSHSSPCLGKKNMSLLSWYLKWPLPNLSSQWLRQTQASQVIPRHVFCLFSLCYVHLCFACTAVWRYQIPQNPGGTNSFELTCGYWELNPGPLEEQPVLLTSEQSLQPPSLGLYFHVLALLPMLHPPSTVKDPSKWTGCTR